MALHIEQVITTDLIPYLQSNYPAQLDLVLAETGSRVLAGLSPPTPQNYFIGEPSRFRAYQAPAVFVITMRTTRPGEGQGTEYATLRYQEHRVLLDYLIESIDEQLLTRACWRVADAADRTLSPNVDVSTDSVRTTKVFVTDIDYGVLFTGRHAEQRVFRKDVAVELLIKHWDVLT